MLCQQYRLPGGAKMEDRIMKKLGMLGIIGGAAILTAVPLSLQCSQKNVTLLLSSAEAQERPLTATSVAGVSRRAYRRAEVTSLAAHYHLPAVYPRRFFAELGGLLSYGNDQSDNFRRT